MNLERNLGVIEHPSEKAFKYAAIKGLFQNEAHLPLKTPSLPQIFSQDSSKPLQNVCFSSSHNFPKNSFLLRGSVHKKSNYSEIPEMCGVYAHQQREVPSFSHLNYNYQMYYARKRETVQCYHKL